jgi:hypothetical protein
MATQIIMDHTGDSRHLFNPAYARPWQRPRSASKC